MENDDEFGSDAERGKLYLFLSIKERLMEIISSMTEDPGPIRRRPADNDMAGFPRPGASQ